MTIPNIVVSAPSQLFTLPDSFAAIAGGSIYIGQIDTDPTVSANQIQAYVQNNDGSTIAVSQPISIGAGGYPEYNGAVAKFVTLEGQSMTVLDANGTLQYYYPDVLKYGPGQLSIGLSDYDGLKYIGRCPSVQALRLILPTTDGQKIDLIEYATGTGAGGGYLYFDESDKTSPDNSVTIFVGPSGSRWKRIITGSILAEWGGVASDGASSDQSEALQRVIDTVSVGTIVLPAGAFKASVTISSQAISFVGVHGATQWHPASYASLSPCIKYLAGTGQRFREIKDIEFISGGAKQGIAVYYNAVANLRITSCRFTGFQYCGYFNSSEWCRFDNTQCYSSKYGFFFTRKTGDILGLNPTYPQWIGPHYVTNCSFQTVEVPFVWYDYDGSADRMSNLNIQDTEILAHNVGIYSGGINWALYAPMNLNRVWFEKGSDYTGTQTIDGTQTEVTIPICDVYLDGTVCDINGSNLGNNHYFVNGSRIRINDCFIYDNYEENLSSDSIVTIEDSVTDMNGGSAFLYSIVKGTTFARSTRNILFPISPRIPFDTPYLNLFGEKGLCNGSAQTKIGSGAYTNITGDGFYEESSIEVSGANDSGDGIAMSASLTVGKYYVTTFSINTISGSTRITAGAASLGVSANVTRAAGWHHYAILAQATATQLGYLYLTTNGVFRLSACQCIQFNSLSEALLFSEGSVYSTRTSINS